MEARKEVERAQNSQDVERMTEANAYYRELYDIACEVFGLKKISESKWVYSYWTDKSFNEVMVDFR